MDIEHFALNVADPVAAATWYSKHLELCVVRSLNVPPFTHFLVDDSRRGVIELYGHARAPVPDYAAMDPLVFHIAFVTNDVEGTRDRLLAAGASRAGEVTTNSEGDEMVFLRDPWGVALQLVKRASALVRPGRD